MMVNAPAFLDTNSYCESHLSLKDPEQLLLFQFLEFSLITNYRTFPFCIVIQNEGKGTSALDLIRTPGIRLVTLNLLFAWWVQSTYSWLCSNSFYKMGFENFLLTLIKYADFISVAHWSRMWSYFWGTIWNNQTSNFDVSWLNIVM